MTNKTQEKRTTALWAVLLAAAFAGLLRWPVETAQAVRESLTLYAQVILPALFPFFVLSALVVSSGLASALGRMLEGQMRRLFRVNGRCAAALVLGLIGGYPVGAKTVSELYRSGQCTRAEAQRLLFFCNNAGPAFLIGVVGGGIFHSRAIGLLLEGQMRRLFRVNGRCASALVLGLIGGYPVGAKTTAELYRCGQCSKAEAQRLLFFCNNAGPAFLIGMVGSGIFQSRAVGLLLEGIHVAASLLIGFALRFFPLSAEKSPAPSPAIAAPAKAPAGLLPSAVQGSVAVMLNICGFIVLFGAALTLLDCCGILNTAANALSILLTPLGLDGTWCKILLQGMLELSNGVAALPANQLARSVPMAAFLLGWGGVSVHCQTLSVLEGTGLSIRSCLIGKSLQGVLSAALAGLAIRFWPGAVSAAVLFPAALPAQELPRIGIGVGFFGCGLVLLMLLGGKSQNRGGNQTGNRL